MITYCTNIHPGESWQEIFGNLKRHLPAIKAAVSPGAPFPVGLRLSARAAGEIDAAAGAEFSRWLEQNDLFVPTVNAFPFGSFHVSPVKERVYLPDWRHAERADYTRQVASHLDRWLPEGVRGSLSSVPVAFRADFNGDDFPAVRRNLQAVLEHLDRLRQKSGKEILLALEPEPCCLLETTTELIDFFERLNFPDRLRQGLGICLDCCHHAVEFEDPARTLALLAGAGIPIAKVQVSSAPALRSPDSVNLALFDEPCYLHQVVVCDREGTLARYPDLPPALQAAAARAQAGGTGVAIGNTSPLAPGEEWRIHFHIPIFLERTERFGTTRYFIEEIIPLLDEDTLLEVETYSFDVLPEGLRYAGVQACIIREISWLQEVCDAAHRRT
jgi:sugar phosphate isomerase/epimerase